MISVKFDEGKRVCMCIKHYLEPEEQAKKFKVYSFCKREGEVETFLSAWVCAHTLGMPERSSG